MSTFSESTTIETPIIQMLTKLGYTYINGYDENIHSSCFGRETTRDVLLFDELYQAVQRLNPQYSSDIHLAAINELREIGLNKTTVQANKDAYNLMRNGAKVQITNGKWDRETITIKFLDFEKPENNDFLVVNQCTIQGDFYTRRPDMLVFVNGIPLVQIELKKPTVSVEKAYEDNLQDYINTIPQLYRYNAFVILSNGWETKLGAFSSSRPFFKDWKRTDEQDKWDTSIETAIDGTMTQTVLIDILENFIVYEEKDGKMTKIVTQNHQLLWVNQAFQNIQKRKQLDGKLWVFRHTQGSGKSYSMAFLANKVFRKLKGDFTFVVITDRQELDKQIYDTFSNTGINTEENVRAESISQMRKLLDENHRFVFTLIHKFQERELDIHPVLSDRNDIIVMVDEAHRSQYDQLALNMRNALPNANFIAFTGTPLLAGERVTKNVFGDYVSEYNFKRAVEDWATVPIFYENRKLPLKLENQDIEDDVSDIYEKYDVDDESAEKFELENSKLYAVITSEAALNKIAEDIVNHYFYQDGDWKSLVVCIDKKTTVKMWNKVNVEKEKLKVFLENKLSLTNGSVEIRDIKNILEKIDNFDSAVVVSFGDTKQDEKLLREENIDMKPHRERIKKENLEKTFKTTNKLKMVFVCNMRLTGFDVPDLRTLYLYKPMKGHTLMQTIARVNRVYQGKINGLIVDYINVFKNLQKALAEYASSGTESWVDYPAQDKENLVEIIQENIDDCKLFLKKQTKVEFNDFTQAQWFDQLKVLQKIGNKLLQKESIEKDWKSLANKTLALYKSLLPDKRANQFTSDTNVIKAIVWFIGAFVHKQLDTAAIKQELKWLIDESITVKDFDIQTTWLIKDLSQMDMDKLKEMLNEDNKYIQLKRIENNLNNKIADLIVKRPQIWIFKKRLEETIDNYNLNAIDIEKTFQSLIELAQGLEEEAKKEIESWLNSEEYAIFLKLYKEGLSAKDEKEIRKISHILYEKIMDVKINVLDWKIKTQWRAMMYSVIKDTVFEEIPVPTYNEDEAKKKTEEVYDYSFEYL